MDIFIVSLNMFSKLGLKKGYEHSPSRTLFIISDFSTGFYTIRPYIYIYFLKFGESSIPKISAVIIIS